MFNTTQKTQILYLQHKKENSETDPTQQKQYKQLILTNRKNILTQRFEPMQGVQPSFTTDGIRNFMAQQKQHKKLVLTDSKNIFT